MKYIAIILFTTMFVISCKTGTDKNVDISNNPVVSVKDNTLYKAEIAESMPLGVTGEDSIAIAQSYIDMWINDQLIYDKAQQNIMNKKEIDALVDDYRKSLIVNSYQEQLIKEYFSKAVTEGDLRVFFDENKENFKLKENIIKGLYLKIPANSTQLNNFIKWYKQGTDDAIGNIEKNTLQNAINYEYFYDRWVDFDQIIENIPIVVENKEQYLRANKNIEVKDSTFVYLLNIKEYKLTGDEAPFDYVKGTLADIYIEKRKADYLKQVKKDLYEKALSSEQIKFYDK